MLRSWLPPALVTALDPAMAWVEANVLAWSTLAQLGLVLLALLGLRSLRPAVDAALETRARRLRSPFAMQVALAGSHAVPWLLLAIVLWFCAAAFASAGAPTVLLRLVISLTLAWAVIRLFSRLVRDARVARFVAAAAWLVAALNIVGLLGPVSALLDRMALNVGALRLSLLLLLKAALVLLIAVWAANLIARLVDQQLRLLSGVTPAMQVLAAKLTRAALLTLAVVLALGTVGIDLTAFAVFSGAVGVGVGFGLQKVVSNLISGVILLMDSSIKPGDVIELEKTYGWINELNARYVSVVTRDGTEHLIPNEDLITQRVVNWTYSNDRVRLHVPVGISYKSDLRTAIRLCVEAARGAARVLADPAPVCLVTGFGDSAISLELRFWIGDPRAGVANVRSEVMLRVWDAFQANDIELPFPQRDVHVVEPVALRRSRAS